MALPDLTTLAAVKAYASIDGTAADGSISALITAYSAWIRTWLNRDITSQSYDIRRSGKGAMLALQMPQFPITAASLVEVDGQAIAPAAAWGQPGYIFDDRQIVLQGYHFTRGFLNLHFQFTAGYAQVPADLAQACVELVALRYKLSDKLEWSSKTLAGESVSLITKDMPASVATVLKQYQLVAPL